MNFRDYQTMAMRTAKNLPTDNANLVHAALGLASEVGEFVSKVKRISIYGKTPDSTLLARMQLAHMQEEVGNILWYVALAASALHCSMGNIAQRNIDKLALQYPEKYTDLLAESHLDKGGLSHTES